jgi:hypothetical protein
MRLVSRLLVLVTAVALVACSEGEPAPPRLAQRFVSEADAPGSTIALETRKTANDIDTFVSTFSQFMVDADREEMITAFQEAGFQEAGSELRLIGDEDSPNVPHVASSFYDLESDDGATSVLEWLTTDSTKPCPKSCATVVSDFDVAGIPDARGVRRFTTAEAIEATGLANQMPRDSYWIAFTVGPSVYSVEYAGPPGTVTEQEAEEIAAAWYDRLTADS